MTKEQILDLSNYEGSFLVGMLISYKVLKTKNAKGGGVVATESLADCAFRMRDEVGGMFYSGLCVLFNYMNGSDENKYCWIMRLAPIHWIQAALLAKLETETR